MCYLYHKNHLQPCTLQIIFPASVSTLADHEYIPHMCQYSTVYRKLSTTTYLCVFMLVALFLADFAFFFSKGDNNYCKSF